jgi:hypothetical protein
MRLIFGFLIISIVLFSKLKAVTIFSDNENKIDLIGNLNLAYFNNLKSEHTASFVENNNYYSYIGLAVENKTTTFLTTSSVIDIKINNQLYYPEKEDQTSYKALEINNLYVEFKSYNTSKTKLGIFDSLVSKQTVEATNKASIYWLDAGYSFMNQDSLFGDKSGEDFSTNKIAGIGHHDVVSNFSMNLELSGPKNTLTARDQVEDNLISRDYAVLTSLAYQGDVVGLSVGYTRVQNTIEDNKYFSSSMVNADSFLSSFSLSGDNIYFALAGGYYKNQKLAGITHTGASAYLSYKLTKLVPYVGYQFLYADNINSSTTSLGDPYNLKDRKNYSFEQSVLVIGLSFEVHKGLLLGIEHDNDIRSNSQVDSSLLNPVKQDITSIYIKYLV